MKTRQIKLDTGLVYELAPLTLGAIDDLSDSIEALGQGAGAREAIGAILAILMASLRRTMPSVTMQELRDTMDMEQAQAMLQAVLELSGMSQGGARPASPAPEMPPEG